MTPAALEVEPIPEGAELLWAWFCRLSAARQSGMGPAPISHVQMAEFFRLVGVRPLDWEVAALEAVDRAWINAQDTKLSSPPQNEPG